MKDGLNSRRGLTVAFKSNLESKFSSQFNLPYETNKVKYTSEHTYTPDFTVAKNVFIETKGRFTSADRSKIKRVLEQNPKIIIALVFQKPQQLISKVSITSYAVWCAKNNIPWFDINDKDGIQDFIRKHS